MSIATARAAILRHLGREGVLGVEEMPQHPELGPAHESVEDVNAATDILEAEGRVIRTLETDGHVGYNFSGLHRND